MRTRIFDGGIKTMNNNKIDNEIKNEWFKNHIASARKEGNMEVLMWKRPNDSSYWMKYIFDGSMIYISGDVGSAIFKMTDDISPYHDWNNTYLSYFLQKLVCSSEDRYDFDKSKAIDRLKQWRKELNEDQRKFNKYKFNKLINQTDDCNTINDWAYVVNGEEFNDFISELDQDYWDWIYKIGNETPARLRAYLIGLQMASEQLRKNKISA